MSDGEYLVCAAGHVASEERITCRLCGKALEVCPEQDALDLLTAQAAEAAPAAREPWDEASDDVSKAFRLAFQLVEAQVGVTDEAFADVVVADALNDVRQDPELAVQVVIQLTLMTTSLAALYQRVRGETGEPDELADIVMVMRRLMAQWSGVTIEG